MRLPLLFYAAFGFSELAHPMDTGNRLFIRTFPLPEEQHTRPKRPYNRLYKLRIV